MYIFLATPVSMSRMRWKIRQKGLKTWQKNAQIVLEFLKKCLKFRSNARELLAAFNYFLPDVHKYSYFYLLTLDFLIGDQTRSDTPMLFFFKINCSHG